PLHQDERSDLLAFLGSPDRRRSRGIRGRPPLSIAFRHSRNPGDPEPLPLHQDERSDLLASLVAQTGDVPAGFAVARRCPSPLGTLGTRATPNRFRSTKTSEARNGGAEGIRTLDPHVANVVLSQLSYRPIRERGF